MSTPATPREQPATPGATPAAPAPAAAPASGETVTLPKAEADQLRRDAARAGSAQSELDRLQRQQQRRKTVSEPEPFTAEEKASIVSGVSQLVLSKPEYGKLVQENPALRKVLLGKNPLSILDADNFVDVQDAIDQLEDFLSSEISRVSGGKGGDGAPPAAPPAAPAPVPTNPATNAAPVKTDEEKKKEELDKIPGMEGVEARLASRIGVKS